MTSEPQFSSSDMRIHPLAVPSTLYQQQQQNGNISGTSSTSSSTNGLFQHPSSTSTTATIDDVTTIFVVGFPDDMSEREFQNMFTFSLGFEAASLKWHCKDQEDAVVIEQPVIPPLSTSSSSSSAMNNLNNNNNGTNVISSTNNLNNNNNNNNNNNLAGKKQMVSIYICIWNMSFITQFFSQTFSNKYFFILSKKNRLDLLAFVPG